jgi:hypothetical protein
MKIKLLLGIVALAAAAVGLHVFGPEFVREIHGGQLWPW